MQHHPFLPPGIAGEFSNRCLLRAFTAGMLLFSLAISSARAQGPRPLTPGAGRNPSLPATAPRSARSNEPLPLQRTRPAEQASFRTTQATPTSAAETPAARERADGYWIVSSREVRGTPATDDCVNQLEYLYRSPRGTVSVGADRYLATLDRHRPVCVVIHGSYNSWSDAVRESERSFVWIREASGGRDVQFVFFTWPSDGYVPVAFPVELRVMGRRAAIHGGYLAQLISEFPPTQPVTIIGHSHGARCAVAALHALGGGLLDDGSHLPPGSRAPDRLRTILIAAAVDHNWLNPGNRYGRSLDVVESLLVIHNHRDGWLSVYPLHSPIKGQQALGRDGFQAGDREFLEAYQHKIQLLDASPIAGRSHDFAAINTSSEMAVEIQPYLVFAPRQRTLGR